MIKMDDDEKIEQRYTALSQRIMAAINLDCLITKNQYYIRSYYAIYESNYRSNTSPWMMTSGNRGTDKRHARSHLILSFAECKTSINVL